MRKFYANTVHRFLVDGDRSLAIIGFPSALGLSLFVELVLQKTIIAVPLLLVGIACLLYFLVRPNLSVIDTNLKGSENRTIFLLMQSLILLSFIACIILLRFFSEDHIRNPTFFVFVPFISVLLYWSIFYKSSSKFSTAITLTQIIFLGILLTWSQIFNFESILGEDPYYHAQFVENILLSGKIPINTVYSFLPIFHLIVEQFCQISGTTYRLAATLSVGLFQIVINTLFIFLLGRKALNEKIGLLGALLLILSPRHIRMGYEIVPTTLAAIYIPIIMYLIFNEQMKNKSASSVLIMLFTLMMILTHSLTSVWLIVVLLVLVLSYIGYGQLRGYISPLPLSIKMCTLSIVGVLGWWSFATGHIDILGGYLKAKFQTTVLLREVEESVWLNSPVGELVFNNLGMYLFIALSIVGCLYMISRRGNQYTYCFAWTGMITVLITMSGPLLQKFIIVGRWQYFSFILLAVPLALSFVLLHRVLAKRAIFSACCISCLIFTLAFIMIASPTANNDNPLFSPTTHIRYGHSDSEILALETLNRLSDGNMYADTYLSVLLSKSSTGIKNADQMIYGRDFHKSGEEPILIREKIISRPVDMFRNIFFLGYDPRIVLNRQGYSQMYNNGGVFAYLFV